MIRTIINAWRRFEAYERRMERLDMGVEGMNVDLTKITTPFGLLDPETQEALRKWEHGVEEYRVFGWSDVNENPIIWICSVTYRARPEPLVPDSINWEHVAPEWKWMARDESEVAWLYDMKPSLGHSLFMIRGVCTNTKAFASYRRGTVAWQDSLVQRPEGV